MARTAARPWLAITATMIALAIAGLYHPAHAPAASTQAATAGIPIDQAAARS